jgi:hypothetical protein
MGGNAHRFRRLRAHRGRVRCGWLAGDGGLIRAEWDANAPTVPCAAFPSFTPGTQVLSASAAPPRSERVAGSRALGGRLAESNPAATGLASAISMRCDANRRPGIGTVRRESAAKVTARYRPVAALSLLHCVSPRSRVMAGTGFYKNGADGPAGFVSEASRRCGLGRRASGFVSRTTLAVRRDSGVEDARRPYDRVESRREGAGLPYVYALLRETPSRGSAPSVVERALRRDPQGNAL